jgi:hypothetical protein
VYIASTNHQEEEEDIPTKAISFLTHLS